MMMMGIREIRNQQLVYMYVFNSSVMIQGFIQCDRIKSLSQWRIMSSGTLYHISISQDTIHSLH